MSFGRRGFSHNRRVFGLGQLHKDGHSHGPMHITIQHHQARPTGEDQTASYIPRSRVRFQQQQQYALRSLKERSLILSTHFVDQSASAVYSFGDYVIVWSGGNRVLFQNIARQRSENDNQYNVALLPTFSDTSVTSVAFCDNYLFYSTATAIYALQITSSTGPVYTQAVCLAREQPADPGPLHSLTVHKTENLYVVTIGAGYGLRYLAESGTYLSSTSSILVYEISILMLSSSTSNSNFNSDTPVELSSSVHAYKYVLDGPIFALTTALDRGLSSFFQDMSPQTSKFQSPYPDMWPYNIPSDQLEMYKKASFLKVCVSTAVGQTMRPEILVMTFLLNLRESSLEVADNKNILFLKIWHIPFINRSTRITSDTLHPAKDPLALSDDGSWLLCWSSATKTKHAVWVLAFDVSFSSLLSDDSRGEGLPYHQFSLPFSVASVLSTTPPSILQLSGTNFSNTRIFYMLCRNGDSTVLYTLSIPRTREHSSTRFQRATEQLQPTLVRIDREYASQEVSPGSYIISLALYKYVYFSFHKESQRQCEGICILWSDGSLSLAKTYQTHPSQAALSSSQQIRTRQMYSNSRPGPPISVITQH